jgi:putative membrane protein
VSESPQAPRYSRTARVLGLVFALLWLALAIDPLYRQDWLLENVLVLVAVPLLVRFGPDLRLSDASWACLFVFFSLHVIGAHYTYSEVPYQDWYEGLSGRSFEADFGIGRNQYDRLVHFLYGLLMALPVMELLDARARPTGLWRWLVPVLFLISHGSLYELIEWGAAETFGGDLGAAYLGTQGDIWDAQKDTALAALGAVLGVTFWLPWRAWRPRVAR